MLKQLKQLVEKFGKDAVTNNDAVPNEQNEAVIGEASESIFSGLKKMVSEGNVEQLSGLFRGENAEDPSNPVVQKLIEQLSGSLSEKFGFDSATTSSVAGSLVPKVIGSLIGKAKDPNDTSFQVSDLVNAISGDNGNSGLMDAISKYGVQFGLDQNEDGKLDMEDAMATVTKNGGGLGGLLKKLFGR